MSVDFPEPEAPTTKTNSPFSITSETSSSAWIACSYSFETPSKTIIAPALAGGGVRSSSSGGVSVCGGFTSSPGKGGAAWEAAPVKVEKRAQV